MNLKNLSTKCSMLLAIILLGHLAVSCSDTETTDSSNFTLHYYGVTDIGPSMSYDLTAPSYIGSEPYDFTITNVTLDEKVYSNESFSIESSTGEIHIKNTANLATGLYSISVSCYSNGSYYEFKDAVKVNMLLAVPKGITVTPKEVLVKQDESNWLESSAQVTTEEGTHVSIKAYAIAQGDKGYEDYFMVSSTGKVTVNAKFKDKIEPGKKYLLSLKITTNAGEHLYPDAVTFNVISKPLNLLYTPNSVKAEKGEVFASETPTIQGSEGMTYAIESVTPSSAKSQIQINETTGVISLLKNNTLVVSETPYNISVKVSNEYGSTTFNDAYSILVINYIAPIKPETFVYAPAEVYEGISLIQKPNEGLIGDEVLFDFAADNVNTIKEQINKNKISINKQTGDISISQDNTLTPSTTPYGIKVKAYNNKGEATAICQLTIKANPNKFTYIRYNNNIGLNPTTNASQYEVSSKAELGQLELIPNTDLPEGKNAKWELVIKDIMAGNKSVGVLAQTTIDANTGVITFKEAGYITGSMNVGMLLVKATVGTGATAYSLSVPIFIRCNVNKNNVLVKYKPIVFQVNPKTGGRSEAPTITSPDNAKFAMDFRKDFNFFKMDSEAMGDLTTTNNSLLNEVWTKCFEDLGLPVNTGAKKPLSYYDTSNGVDNTKNLSKLLGYIDPSNYSIVINPNVWKSSDGKFANGVLLGRISYITDGNLDNLNNGSLFYPVAIWFDENF